MMTKKIQMTEISQNIHKNDGIDHNFNMVLSILNIKNIYNTNFSPGISLWCSNIWKNSFLYEKSSFLSKIVIFYKKTSFFIKKTSNFWKISYIPEILLSIFYTCRRGRTFGDGGRGHHGLGLQTSWYPSRQTCA